jgi:predicted nucleotidyltransferase
MNDNPNLLLLTQAAERLQPLLEEIVFVGGCATGLLVTDSGAPRTRVTTDVDVIVEIASRGAYYKLEARLRDLGFQPSVGENAPICRWIHSGLEVDVMPTDEGILGFSNPWYAPAIHHSQRQHLRENLEIRLITAPYFIATKLEAFHSRGKDDVWISHDLEDVISVVDGRVELLEDVQQADTAIRQHLAREFTALLEREDFLESLAGQLPPDAASQRRVPAILKRLRVIANFA